jgi:hypothetical protein
MTMPDLVFGIRGRDQSGAAFRSARRHIDDTRRAATLLNGDVKIATASITGLGKAALIGATGIGGLAAAIHKMKIGLADFDRIAKVARQNGLDGEFYQTLAFMAGEASLEVSTLDTALRKFTVGVGQAAEGSGSLYTELRRLNPELLEALLNAGSGEEQIRLYSDAVRNASSVNERAALVAAGFGQRGAELVRVLELGSSAMDDAGKKARDLGNIIEDDVLPYAEEMQNRLGNASDALDKQLKASLITISPLMVNFYENMSSVVKITREWSDDLNNIPETLTKIGNADFFKKINLFLANRGLLSLGDAEVHDPDLKAILERRARLFRGANGGGGWGGGTEINGDVPSLGGISVLPRSKPATKPARSWTDPAARAKAATDAERQAKAYQRVIDQLNKESAALGMNSTQQRIANELALAGVDATSTQGQQIARMVTQLEQQRAAQEAFNDRLRFFGEMGAGTFRDLITGADTFEGAMRRVALSIGDAALQAAIFGEGPLAALLGMGRSGGNAFGGLLGLFGGGGSIPGLSGSSFAGWYDQGGGIGAGKWGIAGESGVPEIVTGPAHVWTMDDMAAIAGGVGGGGGDVYAPVYNVDARGAQEGVAQQIMRALEDYDSRVAPATARNAVGRANRTSSSNDFRR